MHCADGVEAETVTAGTGGSVGGKYLTVNGSYMTADVLSGTSMNTTNMALDTDAFETTNEDDNKDESDVPGPVTKKLKRWGGFLNPGTRFVDAPKFSRRSRSVSVLMNYEHASDSDSDSMRKTKSTTDAEVTPPKKCALKKPVSMIAAHRRCEVFKVLMPEPEYVRSEPEAAKTVLPAKRQRYKNKKAMNNVSSESDYLQKQQKWMQALLSGQSSSLRPIDEAE